jgi:hypothetical protein
LGRLLVSSQEIALAQPRWVIDPSTGEVVDLDSPIDQLAACMDNIRELESRIREEKSKLTREFLERFDKQAEWSTVAGDFQVSAPSPKPREEFDGPGLHEALRVLVDDGTISVEALDAAVETVISYEPRRTGINKLRKLGGRAEKIIRAYTTETQPTRYVKVSRRVP